VSWLAVVAQALCGAATVVIVARLTARETENRLAGLGAGAVAAIHVSFVFWTAYLLSETLFLLLLAVTADRLLVIGHSRRPALSAFGVGILSAVAIAARPTGVAFVAACGLALFALTRRQSIRSVPVLSAYAAPFAALVLAGVALAIAAPTGPAASAPGRLGEWLRSGVQNGLVETEYGRATSGVDLDVNPPPIIETLPTDQRVEFVDLGPFGFAAKHPEFVAQQSLRKLRMFWTPVLPEYSLFHAILSGTYFAAFYALTLAGFAACDKGSPLSVLCLSSVVMFTLTSVITIVDYDQRYRLPAELFMLPFAGVGLARIVERMLAATLPRVPLDTSRPKALTQ